MAKDTISIGFEDKIWKAADVLLKTGIGTFIVTITLLVVFLVMNIF